MKFTRTSALFLSLLPLLAAASIGCSHKAPAPVSQVATAPPLPPSSMTQVPAVPSLPAPAQPQVGPPGSDQKAEENQPAPVHKSHRPKKRLLPVDPPTMAATPPPPATVASASIPAPPSLGQLSAGAGADSRERAAMSEQIHAQEVRLGNLKHPLNDEDEAITKQIEAFLAKARQAVAANDLDGAQTLTTKAKVLLDELSRS